MSIILKIYMCILFCLLPQVIKAENDSLSFYLPPLEMLINEALNNSPLIKEKHTQTKIKVKDLQIERRKWMNYLFLEGSAAYGLYDRLVTQDNTTSSSPSGLLSQSEQTTYYTGFGLKLPFSSFTNRNRELKKKHLEIEKSQYEMNEAEGQLRLLVIEQYYNLRYLEGCMNNFYEIYQTMQISYKKSQKDLYSGRSDINQFALLASTVGKAKNDYLKAYNAFWAAYKSLESIIGVKFNELK